MESLKLEGSPKTPHVNFDPETGLMELKGRSIPENSLEFYKPLIDWIDQYGRSPQAKSTLHMQLEYFNTSSSKSILDVFKKLEAIRAAGNEVNILWHYEADDEDMLEAGEDYAGIINVPFKMILIEEVDGQ